MAKPTPPELIKWLDSQLEERGWSDNELAKRAGLNSSTISRVRSGTAPAHEACDAIAQAFAVPAELVFKLAGLLPKGREFDPEIDELVGLFGQRDSKGKHDTLRIVRVLLEGQGAGRKVKG